MLQRRRRGHRDQAPLARSERRRVQVLQRRRRGRRDRAPLAVASGVMCECFSAVGVGRGK
jgi:hypothetical protein